MIIEKKKEKSILIINCTKLVYANSYSWLEISRWGDLIVGKGRQWTTAGRYFIHEFDAIITWNLYHDFWLCLLTSLNDNFIKIIM